MKEKIGKRLQLEGWEETSFNDIRADDIIMACLFYFRIALEIVLRAKEIKIELERKRKREKARETAKVRKQDKEIELKRKRAKERKKREPHS